MRVRLLTIAFTKPDNVNVIMIYSLCCTLWMFPYCCRERSWASCLASTCQQFNIFWVWWCSLDTRGWSDVLVYSRALEWSLCAALQYASTCFHLYSLLLCCSPAILLLLPQAPNPQDSGKMSWYVHLHQNQGKNVIFVPVLFCLGYNFNIFFRTLKWWKMLLTEAFSQPKVHQHAFRPRFCPRPTLDELTTLPLTLKSAAGDEITIPFLTSSTLLWRSFVVSVLGVLDPLLLLFRFLSRNYAPHSIT